MDKQQTINDVRRVVVCRSPLLLSGGLAIFVKTPALSPVKTRLARDVGQLRAEAFYLASAEAVASVALQSQTLGGAIAYWAVAEPSAMTGNAWIDLPCIPQGYGTLGERMDQVYRLLLGRHRYALLLGADTPQITQSSLARAATWLAAPEPRLVLGRAEDGGFWLFGGNAALSRTAWCSPHYSNKHTADELVAAMSPFGDWLALELEPLTAVDCTRDLPPMRRQLERVPEPTLAQQRLAQWLDDGMGGAIPRVACQSGRTSSK